MTEEEEIKKRPLPLPLPHSPMANDNQPATFTLNIKALLSLPYRLCNPPPAVGKVRSCGVTPVFKVQLDDILDRKHLPPLGLKDFEEWLLFVEQCPENLYFILWLRDYSARYAQWSRKSLPHKKDSIRASPSVSWLTNKPLTSPSLALAYARAKQTFLTPNASYELAVPSALLAPFHTTNFGSPHPDPRVFADVAAEAQKRLKDSLRRFVTASYHNVGTYRATCGIVAGALFCIAGAVPPVVVNLVEGRSRWLRLLAVPGLWFGLTILIASLHGVCMMIYIFGDVRQLRKFELQRPAISRPKPLQNPRGVSSATAFTGSESSYTSSSGYSTRTSISRGSRRSRRSNRKAKKAHAHAHAKAQKINQASFVRPSPARALTGPPKISIAIPQTAAVRREAYDSYNANNGLGMGMGTTSPSVRSDTTALTATTASDSVAIPTPAMTPLGAYAYAYAYAYPSASAYDARGPVARGRRLSSCLNIELESVSGVTVGDGDMDEDLVLDEEFDQGGYSDVDVRSSRFGEDSSLSEEDDGSEDEDDISEDEDDEDEDGSYEEHGIYISRVYGPDEDEYADTDVDADGVSVIVDPDVDLEAQRDSGRVNNVTVGGRTMGILGIAKSFLGAAAASAQGGERREEEGQITTATTASTSTAVTIPTTASFIPPFPYDGEHDRVSVKSAKSGRSARSRLSAKIGAGMSAGMSAVGMGGRNILKQQPTVFDFDALPPPLAKSQLQGQGGAVNVNVISAPINEHTVPMSIPMPIPGQLGQDDYALPMPRMPRAPVNEKEKKTMWARFRDMLGKKQDACQECKERERGLKAVDVGGGGGYDLEKQSQFQQQQSISTTPVHVTLSSNNGIDEKSGMPMPGGYQGYTYQLSPIDSEPASASTLGPPSPNPLLGTGMSARNLPVVSPNPQTQTQIISKPSPPPNQAQEKDKSWRTNYLTIQAVPAFGPVTRVLSPVVTRAQWEIVVRSFAVAGVVAWVVVGSLLALPEMPVGRYMTVVM